MTLMKKEQIEESSLTAEGGFVTMTLNCENTCLF